MVRLADGEKVQGYDYTNVTDIRKDRHRTTA